MSGLFAPPGYINYRTGIPASPIVDMSDESEKLQTDIQGEIDKIALHSRSDEVIDRLSAYFADLAENAPKAPVITDTDPVHTRRTATFCKCCGRQI